MHKLLPENFEKGSEGRREHSAVDYIVERVRNAIRTGRLVPGQRLVQEELTAGLSISRGPVREALRRLAAEGLVDLQFNRGARVRLFTRTEIMALAEAREAIETMAARLAAWKFATSEHADEFRNLMAEMAATAAQNSQESYLELNERFHDLIFTIAQNPVLTKLGDQLHTHIVQHQFRAIHPPGWVDQSHAEHVAIWKAVMQGEELAAADAMRAHLDRVAELSASMPPAYYEAL